jgi:predicted helicase
LGDCLDTGRLQLDEEARAIDGALPTRFLSSISFNPDIQFFGNRFGPDESRIHVIESRMNDDERINRLIREEGPHQKAFESFLSGLQKNINPSVTQQEAVEMLSQHIITKPVFDALFEGYSFVQNNPISVSMQGMLDLLEAQAIEKDTVTLAKFYESVKMRASGIDNAEGKQRIIIELYDKFFKTAFPKMVEKLGIVYTPVEVVDFMLHSVDDVLRQEFGRGITDEDVHLLDPFTGTGTFMTRLLQSGLIEKKDLVRKYTQELYANEIVLLAYYIAAVNIENAFHDTLGGDGEYVSFEGICLTDTFQLGETEVTTTTVPGSDMFPRNTAQVEKQKKAPLRVILGNPPYSVGQRSANDNAQNQSYEMLDARIGATYAKETDATNKNSLYNSYFKAFRWASDRLDKEHGGIICFVSDGGWLGSNSQDGFRKRLEREFSSIYVFNLRGNARLQGEVRRKEAGNVFGSGSRQSITITLLVKNPEKPNGLATIHYHDIGDYLSQKEKLAIVEKFGSVATSAMKWRTLHPNEHGDWINQRSDVFETLIALGDKVDKKADCFFVPSYSNGVKTQRDAWCYNSSRVALERNVHSLVAFYNEQRISFQAALKENPELEIRSSLSYDSKRISWSPILESGVAKDLAYSFDRAEVVTCVYRPFFKQHLYFSRTLNERVYQTPILFPTPTTENRLICISSTGANKPFSVIAADCVPDLHFNGDTQCFPLYYYEERDVQTPSLFDSVGGTEYIRRDGVSDFILKRGQKQYGKSVTKKDIFYYVYGFLHSPAYRLAFANDLKKTLPRIPLVDDVRDFWAFSKAGRALAELHINYESVSAYSGVTVTGAESGLYTVQKMRFPKKDQKETILFNSKITISDIPPEAYEYVVNGKSAIEWIMDRYKVTVHKASGIKNDPNDWTDEVGNPRYILDLLLSVINVSVQTVGIVQGLPEVSFG